MRRNDPYDQANRNRRKIARNLGLKADPKSQLDYLYGNMSATDRMGTRSPRYYRKKK